MGLFSDQQKNCSSSKYKKSTKKTEYCSYPCILVQVVMIVLRVPAAQETNPPSESGECDEWIHSALVNAPGSNPLLSLMASKISNADTTGDYHEATIEDILKQGASILNDLQQPAFEQGILQVDSTGFGTIPEYKRELASPSSQSCKVFGF